MPIPDSCPMTLKRGERLGVDFKFELRVIVQINNTAFEYNRAFRNLSMVQNSALYRQINFMRFSRVFLNL